MKGLDHRLTDDFNRLQKFEKERVKMLASEKVVDCDPNCGCGYLRESKGANYCSRNNDKSEVIQ